MIKLLALILMIFDHIGHMLCSGVVPNRQAFLLGEIFLILGRFSMPLFAYCIARGFSHYLETRNMKKYFRNISIMAVVSQLPYWFFRYKMKCFLLYPKKVPIFYDFFLNIGFTWLVSLLLLCVLNKINFSLREDMSVVLLIKKNFIFIFLAVFICVVSIFIKLEYGLYGVLFPVIFYYFCFKFNNPLLFFVFNCMQYFLYCAERSLKPLDGDFQIFAILVVFLIIYLRKHDKLRLPKFIFYWFYPAHLVVLSLLYVTVFVKH